MNFKTKNKKGEAMKRSIALVLFVSGLLTLNASGQTILTMLTNNLHEPYGVAVDDANNNWYITDSANNRIYQFNDLSTKTKHLAGSINFAPGYADSANPVNARFANPQGILLLPDGTLLVADSGNHALRRVTTNGVVTTVAGTPPTPGRADGIGQQAQFNAPAGMALDAANGVVYIADLLNDSIRKLELANNRVTTLTNATNLLRPSAIAIDPADGLLFVADTGNHVIRVMLPDGTPTANVLGAAVFGQPGTPGWLDGDLDPANTLFNAPSGLAWDNTLGLIVADTGNHAIRRIYKNKDFDLPVYSVQTFANSAAANLRKPIGLTRTAEGNFPLIDLGSDRALLIQLAEPQVRLGQPIIGRLTFTNNIFGILVNIMSPLIAWPKGS